MTALAIAIAVFVGGCGRNYSESSVDKVHSHVAMANASTGVITIFCVDRRGMSGHTSGILGSRTRHPNYWVLMHGGTVYEYGAVVWCAEIPPHKPWTMDMKIAKRKAGP
jgi:hypothetical protein